MFVSVPYRPFHPLSFQAIKLKDSQPQLVSQGLKVPCLGGSLRPLRPSELPRPEEHDSSVLGEEGRKEEKLLRHTSGIGSPRPSVLLALVFLICGVIMNLEE